MLLLMVVVEIVARGVVEVDRRDPGLGCCKRFRLVNTRCRTVGVPSLGGSSVREDSAMESTLAVTPRGGDCLVCLLGLLTC